ncbi:tetratricopeptide repeat protein [Thermoflavimicrobium daqui]|jgi:hypothetical protein|nr:tetratricopeptide repeat protein [Thermoflavimicrobium daqui]
MNGIALSYIGLDELCIAKEWLESTMQAFPNMTHLIVNMGILLQKMGYHDEAITYFKKAVKRCSFLRDARLDQKPCVHPFSSVLPGMKYDLFI